MAVAYKGNIVFGLVQIPVTLHTATRDLDVRFNQLHRGDHRRIRYKKVCGHCQKEVTGKDIVRGFEYADDKFVIITDEDLARIKTPEDRTVNVLQFVDRGAVSPVYFDRTFHAAPATGGEKAYRVLADAMRETHTAALCRTVMENRDTLVLLVPDEEGILAETLFYDEEVRRLPKISVTEAPTAAELKMAKTLISRMKEPFQPQQYHDEYRKRLKRMIEDKIAGKRPKVSRPQRPSNVIALGDALRASVQETPPRGRGRAGKPVTPA